MGAIAALLALGGIVALAAYSAADSDRPAGAPPPSGGPPPPLPPLALPSQGGGSNAYAPSPTPASHTPGADPYTATPVPSHCPPGLNMADPTARALCGPSPGEQDGAAPILPVSTAATNVPSDLVQRVRRFMESDPSPEQIEELATQLERAGLPDAARQLREVAMARRIERARAAATPSPAPSPSTPSPSPAPSPTAPEPQPGPPSPAGTPGPSSSSATESDSSPRPADSGEPLSGRQLAAQTADALRERLSEIQRLTRAFQDAANIDTDGQYGPVTRAALTFWSGRTAPRPWVGSGSPRYTMRDAERGDGSPVSERAERTGRQLFAALLEPEGDAKPQVERFQRTVGLTVDGKYGQQTRAALGRLGVANPPPAFRRSRARSSARSSGGSSRRRSG